MRPRRFRCLNHRYTSTYLYKDALYEWFWCSVCKTHWCKLRKTAR